MDMITDLPTTRRTMSGLAWYAGRAARMSPREMAWRARRVVDTLAGHDGLREHPDPAVLGGPELDWDAALDRFRCTTEGSALLDPYRAEYVAAQHPAAVAELLAEADRLLTGERTFFGYPAVNVGHAVDWNLDAVTGYRWPVITGNRIDHRVAPSDPKWIWEHNRLQHLPLLAQAWLFTGAPHYAETALAHLESWLDQNPPGTGISWRGAFEPGVRALSVAIALQGLRNSPALTTARYRGAVRMLDASARYCWHARSRFSSANNHLIGELSGLIAVEMVFPELAAPAALRSRAVDALSDEAGRLILPDGSGAEQSIAYQIFTHELLATVLVLLQMNGHPVPPQLTAALHRGGRYLISLVGSDDPDPRYGDDDDSFALRLGAERKRTVRQHLGLIAMVTGDASAARYGENTLSAAWVGTALGRPAVLCGAGVGTGEVRSSGYAAHGGLAVLRDGNRRVTVDVGPLGYLSTAAHGHADALSVTVSDRGHELIVDPGTGSFYGNPAVRAVHRGTRAHATVCVDGVDQSVMGGPFFWRRHARTTIYAVDSDRGLVDAEHDGYRRLHDPVVHRRWVVATPAESTVVVIDLIAGRSEHEVTVSWPLHPDLDATRAVAGQQATRDGAAVLELCYAATAPIDFEQVRAERESQLGWWSDRLEARTPAWLVGVRCRAVAPVAVLSLLHVGDHGAITRPQIYRAGSVLAVRWTERGVRHGLTVDTSRPGAVFDDSCSPTGLVGKS